MAPEKLDMEVMHQCVIWQGCSKECPVKGYWVLKNANEKIGIEK